MKRITILFTFLILSAISTFAQTNIALSKIVTSYSLYSGTLSLVNDGNLTTGISSTGSVNLTVDLGNIYSISSLKVKIGAVVPSHFAVYSSVDNVNYNSVSRALPTANTLCDVVFSNQPNNVNQHRYIRLSFMPTSGTTVQLFEVQIFGSMCFTLEYFYDEQGGRKSRSIFLSEATGLKSESLLDSTIQSLKEDLLPSPENTFFDAVGESKVTIYPNPTRGELVVKVTNESEEATHRIMLFDSNGAIIYQKENATEYTDVDITDRPSGFYILKIFNGENSTTWKVIKQ